MGQFGPRDDSAFASNGLEIHAAITERNGRLLAIQDRWDALREAKACFAREDYEGAMKTGVVPRKTRAIRAENGNGFTHVDEYEINSALIECRR
jgi:hypothetical protein